MLSNLSTLNNLKNHRLQNTGNQNESYQTNKSTLWNAKWAAMDRRRFVRNGPKNRQRLRRKRKWRSIASHLHADRQRIRNHGWWRILMDSFEWRVRLTSQTLYRHWVGVGIQTRLTDWRSNRSFSHPGWWGHSRYRMGRWENMDHRFQSPRYLSRWPVR